jgi:hypothetical protein
MVRGEVPEEAIRLWGSEHLHWQELVPLLRLALACMTNEVDAVRHILEEDPSLVDVPTSNYNLPQVFFNAGFPMILQSRLTPLMLACGTGSVEVALGLVNGDFGARADVHAQSSNGRARVPMRTALDFAQHHFQKKRTLHIIPLVCRLIDEGVDPWLTDGYGSSAVSRMLEMAISSDTHRLQHEYPDQFQVYVEGAKAFFNHLEVTSPRPSEKWEAYHHEKITECLMGGFRRADLTPESMEWFKAFSGHGSDSFVETMMVFLLKNGASWPPCIEFATRHAPEALVWLEKNQLESGLSPAPPPTSRLRL